MKGLQALLRKIFWKSASLKEPKAFLQDTMRRLNEKVPEMSRVIALLKKKLLLFQHELTKLDSKEESLGKRLESARQKNSENIIVSLEDKCEIIRLHREELTEDYRNSHAAYDEALSAMNIFINEQKRAIQKALQLIDERERREWQKRLSHLLSRFNTDFQSDRNADSLETDFSHRSDGSDINNKKKYNERDRYLSGQIKEAKKKLRELSSLKNNIPDAGIQLRVDKLIQVSKNILKNLKAGKKKTSGTRMFLSYYIDGIIEIVRGYMHLSSGSGAVSEGIEASLKRAERLIDTLIKALEKLESRMKEYDVINLDVEITVLEKALREDHLA